MRSLARGWVVIVIVLVCGYALHAFDWGAIRAAMVRLDPVPLLAITVVSTLAVFAACAARWVAVNQLPWHPAVVLNAYAYVAVVIGVSIVTPLQVGEVLKVKFAQDAGLPLGRAAVNLALERVLDLAAVSAMAIYWALRASGGGQSVASLTAAGLVGLGCLAPVLLQATARRWRGTRFGARLSAIAGSPLPNGAYLVVILATAAKWGMTVLAWTALLRVAGARIDLSQGMSAVGAVTAISLASMVPGGVGVQEVSARALLVSFGADEATAGTGAIALRLFTPVMVVLGLLHFPLIRGKRTGQVRATLDG